MEVFLFQFIYFKMIHLSSISARKSQEDETGMLFAINVSIFDFLELRLECNVEKNKKCVSDINFTVK